MKKLITGTLFISLVTTLALTGCNKPKVNESIENTTKPIQAIEYLYDSEGRANREFSDKDINATVVTEKEIEQIPLTYGEKTYTQEERELFAKQAKAMQPGLDFTDDFIKTLYNINPNNIVQQAKKMANVTIDQVKPEYENIVNQVMEKKITRKYDSYKVDQIMPIDAKISDNGELVPGRIVSAVVYYKGISGNSLEDGLELHLINLDGTWKLASFKVIE